MGENRPAKKSKLDLLVSRRPVIPSPAVNTNELTMVNELTNVTKAKCLIKWVHVQNKQFSNMMLGNALGVDKFGTVMKGTSFKREFPMKAGQTCLVEGELRMYSAKECFFSPHLKNQKTFDFDKKITMIDCGGLVSDEIKPKIIYNFTYEPTISRSQPVLIDVYGVLEVVLWPEDKKPNEQELKLWMPAAQGSSNLMELKVSHISIVIYNELKQELSKIKRGDVILLKGVEALAFVPGLSIHVRAYDTTILQLSPSELPDDALKLVELLNEPETAPETAPDEPNGN